MLTIRLKDLKIHALHGVYPQEGIVGGWYVVNVEADLLPAAPVVTRLEDSLNYETLFQMVDQRMRQPTPLLEQVAMELSQQVIERFPEVLQVRVAIEKCNPPIEGMEGSVQVSHRRNRH